ncbi:MAG TPA: winged helix-turn-helix domain-containing protein [Bacteroidales bacterium]|nr:winged helix-turn-helix domain-containing protein [Bacteroidales bacterium]
MASSRKEGFSLDEKLLADFAKALSHPARVAILKHLASLETCCFNEISREIPLADSTVSQHLDELKKAGLIQGNIESPRIKYCINWDNWQILRKMLKEFAELRIVKYE